MSTVEFATFYDARRAVEAEIRETAKGHYVDHAAVLPALRALGYEPPPIVLPKHLKAYAVGVVDMVLSEDFKAAYPRPEMRHSLYTGFVLARSKKQAAALSSPNEWMAKSAVRSIGECWQPPSDYIWEALLSAPADCMVVRVASEPDVYVPVPFADLRCWAKQISPR